jgi:hypothetical protein
MGKPAADMKGINPSTPYAIAPAENKGFRKGKSFFLDFFSTHR